MRFPCLTILSLARERIHVVLCLPTFSVRQPRWNIAPIEWHPSGSKPNHRSNRPTVSQRCVYVFVSNVEQTNRVWGSKITVVKSRHLFRNAATMNIPIELKDRSGTGNEWKIDVESMMKILRLIVVTRRNFHRKFKDLYLHGCVFHFLKYKFHSLIVDNSS